MPLSTCRSLVHPSLSARIVFEHTFSAALPLGASAVLSRFLPQANFRVPQGVGHLSPLEAPDAVADACTNLLGDVSTQD